MAVIAGVMLGVQSLCRVNVEKWEHYGDYLVGVSMVACALYFISRESSFLVRGSDGSYVQKPCACHGSSPHGKVLRHPKHRHGKSDFCKFYGSGCEGCGAHEEGTDEEAAPLVPDPHEHAHEDADDEHAPEASGARHGREADSSRARLLSGAVLGVLQGMCCPMGLVGISFLAQLPPAGIVGFLVVFLLMSAFGTAALAAGWAHLTSRGIGVSVSPRLVYRGSCGFTLVLGLTWVTANYLGFLSTLNYAEGHMHGAASEASGPG